MVRTLLLSCFLFCAISTFAQVGIGTTMPDPSAQLDVVSTNKGLLVPRVASTADVAGSPAKGLVVYQTSGTEGIYVYNGTVWQKMVAASEIFTPAYAYVYSYATFRHFDDGKYDRIFDSKLDGFIVQDDRNTLAPINAGTYLINYKFHQVSGSSYFSELRVDGITVPGSDVSYTDGTIVTAEVIVDLPAHAKVGLFLAAIGGRDEGVTFSSMTITRLK